MDVAPEKFELEHWLPIIRKLVWLAVTIAATFAAGTIEEGVTGDLKTTAATAGEVVRTEQALHDETANLEDAIQFYTQREIGCDLALETFARHRQDERDFQMVVEQCHSEGTLDRPPAEDPSQ